MKRPLLIHEKLAAEVKATLQTVLAADLTGLKRSDLTLMRAELATSKQLQTMCGQVAPWSEWREAAERINAEIACRDAAA